MTFRILVLGGYGNFGTRIVRRLADLDDVMVLVAGRSDPRARALCDRLGDRRAQLSPLPLDIEQPDFPQLLAGLNPNLVVHACGPFQRRDYRVAEAAIAAGSHYVDLADARDFVAGIVELDARARAADVLAVSGASTVPGLTAAIVDRMQPAFAGIDRIDIGISPGNRTARGDATVKAILSYVGAPIRIRRDRRWTTAYGWQSLRRQRYPAPMGRRWLATCDVPDLALFPDRYQAASVEFRAGLELSVLHFGLWLMSWLRRLHLVGDWSRHSDALLRASRWLETCGSDVGGMHVRVEGVGVDGNRQHREFVLIAGQGDGPEIPCTPAVLLASRLASGECRERGARPCLDLFTVDEVLVALDGFDIRVQWS